MICLLGDIHFNSSKDYYRDICEAFLDWYKDWKYNKSTNTLILAGDLVESAANAGIVIDWLTRLLNYSRFNHIYICVGNHDKKIISGVPQLAYEFYKSRDNVTVLENIAHINIEGAEVLFLPYYSGVNASGLSMHDFYSELYKTDEYSRYFDFVVGHVGGPDALFEGSNDCIDNLDKLNAGRLCFGHIHTRSSNPRRYLGSIYACKKNENDSTRAAWLYDPKTGHWSEDRLPVFSEYITVSYPEGLRTTDAVVPIYTILNCTSTELAKKEYGDIRIRKVVSTPYEVMESGDSTAAPASSTRSMTLQDLFKDFVASQSPPLDETVLKKCEALLTVSSTPGAIF